MPTQNDDLVKTIVGERDVHTSEEDYLWFKSRVGRTSSSQTYRIQL